MAEDVIFTAKDSWIVNMRETAKKLLQAFILYQQLYSRKTHALNSAFHRVFFSS
jgi:hypothetical protein